MAADPTARFGHIWHAIMRVLGRDHRVQFNTNKAILKAINRKMGIK